MNTILPFGGSAGQQHAILGCIASALSYGKTVVFWDPFNHWAQTVSPVFKNCRVISIDGMDINDDEFKLHEGALNFITITKRRPGTFEQEQLQVMAEKLCAELEVMGPKCLFVIEGDFCSFPESLFNWLKDSKKNKLSQSLLSINLINDLGHYLDFSAHGFQSIRTPLAWELSARGENTIDATKRIDYTLIPKQYKTAEPN